MTEVRFYHLQHQSQQQVLPIILQRALERGHRALVKVATKEEAKALDDYFWSYAPDGFLPHGQASDKNAAEHPVLLTLDDENKNKADLLILGQGASMEDISAYTLCCDMINGHDDIDVQAARVRWKAYKDQGYILTYLQQTEGGGWEQKA